MESPLVQYATGIPKCELHLHIEGTLEPDHMFELAKRNKVPLKYESVEACKAAYNFTDLQSFLDLYFEGTSVLLQESDFYELALRYFSRAHQDNVRHAEIMFDPQLHTQRGISLETCLKGLRRAQDIARKQWKISSKLIMCFLRHLPESKHWELLNNVKPFVDMIDAVGLDSSEKNFPNRLFKDIMKEARSMGLRIVSHAGEEGPPSNIGEAINDLCSERIDHGTTCTEDPAILQILIDKKIPLTVCPISNKKLGVIENISQHPLLRCSPQTNDGTVINSSRELRTTSSNASQLDLIERGLMVCINSDDPAYFRAYINENFIACLHKDANLNWTTDTILKLALNSVEASFLSEDEKLLLMNEILSFNTNFRP
ncbi:Adenosine/AMP deaminase domain-containing protein [Cardiosporidium cionae]|uniref:Adenosine/AMP deaminase domain-containing protein n=1 Tax=Cardiosporidium cionae TaxID=476202 RepID=A0ABQ7JB10_9APIC|nr:Adenosine/AMP deaminase domain-containing protein [Cardiosporidium cionae]|eukprot:KAF8821187.1 Adenosine/AMP deaminase domain-containing protein [Cardiosporidium cionae]